jgi:hypothetical protein
MRVQPRGGVATLQCTVSDGTGELLIVFLGRRQIPGVEQGMLLAASGVIGVRGNHREMLNPDYRLLAAEP